MMSLLDDVKMVRDEITEAYQNAYDALQEANIFRLISDLVTATPIDYGISIAYRSVMGVEILKLLIINNQWYVVITWIVLIQKVDYAYECFLSC